MHAGDYAGVHLNGFHEDGNLPGNEGVRFGMAGADYRARRKENIWSPVFHQNYAEHDSNQIDRFEKETIRNAV